MLTKTTTQITTAENNLIKINCDHCAKTNEMNFIAGLKAWRHSVCASNWVYCRKGIMVNPPYCKFAPTFIGSSPNLSTCFPITEPYFFHVQVMILFATRWFFHTQILAVLKMHDLCGMSNAKPLRYSSLNLTSLTQFCAILRLYLALPSNFSLSQKLQQYYKWV